MFVFLEGSRTGGASMEGAVSRPLFQGERRISTHNFSFNFFSLHANRTLSLACLGARFGAPLGAMLGAGVGAISAVCRECSAIAPHPFGVSFLRA
jgi:hypothetical protein